MSKRNKAKGFGPDDQPAFSLKLHSFDRVVLDVARMGGKQLSSNPGEQPTGTIVWYLSEEFNRGFVSCQGESWEIELALCSCCPGIRLWAIKYYVGDQYGSFVDFDADDWEGIEAAIETAREIARRNVVMISEHS